METEKKLTGYPSIDKPWLKYYSEEAINAPLPECTVYENIRQHNKDYPNDIALEYFGCKVSYGEMFSHIEDCAKALRQAGIERGDRITLFTAGVPEAVYLVLAASKLGVLANFINPMFEPQQIIDRINDTEARLLFVLDKLYPLLEDAVEKTCIQKVVVIPATGSLSVIKRSLASLKDKPDARLKATLKVKEKYMLWRDFIKAGKVYSGETEAPYIKDTPAVMVYSSGTTGASKGIVLTNDGINATVHQYEKGFPEITRGNRLLHIIPIWFSSGVVISLIMPLCLGVAIILEPVFGEEPFFKDLKKYNPNYIFGTTSLWLFALKHISEDYDLSFLRTPIIGG